MTIQNLNLKAIRLDGGTQSRVAMNQATVDDYAEALDDDQELPPVIVFNDGTDKWLAEGFHRHAAYAKRDRASIPADVRIGTRRDAILFSLSANAKHGLPRTIEDKRKAVACMLGDAEWSKLSDRAIAKACSVSHTFVAGLRNPAPAPAPKPPAPKPEPKGGATTGGTPEGGNAATPKTPPAPPAPPAPPVAPQPPAGPTEAEKNAEEAHGDTDVGELLSETQAELEKALRQIEAMEADDKAAEIAKWQRIADTATRRQQELQASVTDREDELRKLNNTIRRIGRAVGEEDPSKVAATVEAFVRAMKVTA